MSALIVEHNQIKQAIQELETRLKVIESNPEFVKEAEFLEKLKALMGQYKRSLFDVIAILDPDSQRISRFADQQKKERVSRGPKKIQKYRNPHTGEVIETAGGNHRGLKAWRVEYPDTDINDWKVE